MDAGATQQQLQTLLLAARQCLKASQPDRAVGLLETALKLDGRNALALFLAGSARAALGEHATAAAAFRNAAAVTADAAPGSQRYQLHLTCTDNLLLEAERVLPPSWVAALHDVRRLAALQAGITAAVSSAAALGSTGVGGCRVLVVGGLGLEAVLAAQAGAAAVTVYCEANPLAAQLAAALGADSGIPAGTLTTATCPEQLAGQGPFDLAILTDVLGSSIDWQLVRSQLSCVASHLRPGVELLPYAVRIRGHLLECPTAVALNQVDVEQLKADTGGLDLSAANRLLPLSARSVLLPTHRHTALTGSVTLLSVPLAGLLPTVCTDASSCSLARAGGNGASSGSVAAAAQTTQVPVTVGGAADALCWWFEQQLVPTGEAAVLSADPQGCSCQEAHLAVHIWQHLQYLDRRQLAAGQAVEARCSLAASVGAAALDKPLAAAAAAAAASRAVQAMSLAGMSDSGARCGAALLLRFEVLLHGSAGGCSLLLPVSEEQAAVAAAVPLYHTSMLNDRARTSAYRDGIAAALQAAAAGSKEPPLVLEIGSGSGLLCLLACQAGACRIVGCERMSVLQAAAGQLLAANGLADRVTILPKHSKELCVAGPEGAAGGASADLPRRADMLIHEVFGTDPFSEGVVPSLLHARQHLLSPGAFIAPCKLRVVAAVAASSCHHRLLCPPHDVCHGLVTTRALCQLAPRKVDCQAGAVGGLWLLTEPAVVLDLDFCSADLATVGSATVMLDCLPRPQPLASWAAEQAQRAASAAGAQRGSGARSGSGADVAPLPAGTLPAGASLYAVSWFEYEFSGGTVGSTAPHCQLTEHWQQVVQPLGGEAAQAVLQRLTSSGGGTEGRGTEGSKEGSGGGGGTDGGGTEGSCGDGSERGSATESSGAKCSGEGTDGGSKGGSGVKSSDDGARHGSAAGSGKEGREGDGSGCVRERPHDIQALLLTAGYRVDRLWFELAGVAGSAGQ